MWGQFLPFTFIAFVLILVGGGFLGAQSLDTSRLNTGSSLSTGSASAAPAKPVRDSQILKTQYEIEKGSASDFLATNIITLEKVVRGYEELSQAKKKERDQQIRQVVSQVLDLGHLAERALITYWEELKTQPGGLKMRETYVKLFKELVEENYLEKARQYMTGKYQIPLVGEKKQRAHTIVEGRIRKPDVDMIVEFKMNQKADRFQVVDVQLDETSLEGTYRSSFNRIIRKQGGLEAGMSELLRVMQKRLDELKSGEATRL